MGVAVELREVASRADAVLRVALGGGAGDGALVAGVEQLDLAPAAGPRPGAGGEVLTDAAVEAVRHQRRAVGLPGRISTQLPTQVRNPPFPSPSEVWAVIFFSGSAAALIAVYPLAMMTVPGPSTV